MQVKKEVIKNQILLSAKNEFLSKGFEKASIRSIVKNANTTIGNFYNYFESKEDVFDALVTETHTKVMRFIDSHTIDDEDASLLNKLDPNSVRDTVRGALSLFSDSFIEGLILLADCAIGTKHEDFTQKLTAYISKHFQEHKMDINPDYDNPDVVALISGQFVNGVLSILKKDISLNQKVDSIAEYLLFCMYGMLGILKK